MRVELHVEADRELLEASSWIESERTGYGDRFLDAFVRERDLLLRFPFCGSPRSRRARHLRITGFKYDIIYYVVGETIHIVAIAHHSRRPGYWRSRIR